MSAASRSHLIAGVWLRAAALLPATLVCLAVLGVTMLPQRLIKLPITPLPAIPSTQSTRVQTLQVASAEALVQTLDELWEGEADSVPGLAPSRLPEDLDQLPVAERKRAFFRSLLPHVLDRNERIAAERTRLSGLMRRLNGGEELDSTDLRFLGGLADRYRLDVEIADPLEQVRELLNRVDVVPPSIALAQAAIESAWGTSRFSRLGNNLFGQWVFRRSSGIAPLQRPEGANYSLARFPGLGDAVGAYMRNLNGFYAYEEFRRLRRAMREAHKPLDPMHLAAGLRRYSVRRDEYVHEIRSVIRDNRLTRYDKARLATPEKLRSLAL